MTSCNDSRDVIKLDGVNKIYRSKDGQRIEALLDVTLNVREGEFVTIVGPSGCGKSTLMKIIAGLMPRSEGTVLVNGSHVTGALSNVGIVFQNPVLLEWRDVIRNVMFPIEMLGLNCKEYYPKAMELLKLVGLEGFEHRYPYELSGGMQQRVSLCRALVHDPPLLLMDEPFGALDAITRDQMNMELLRIWEERKKTVVFITHSIYEAVILADRVDVMTRRPGRIINSLEIDLGRPRSLSIRSDPRFIEYNAIINKSLGLS